MTVARTAAPAAALRAHQELFAYWSSLRADGARLPARRDLDPGAVKRHLPFVSLIDVRAGARPAFRVRLAGTGLFGVHGREITGLPLDSVHAGPDLDYWRVELERVAEGRPGAGAWTRDHGAGGVIQVLWLRLPLASDGRRVDMILGYDSVVGVRRDPPSGIRAA